MFQTRITTRNEIKTLRWLHTHTQSIAGNNNFETNRISVVEKKIRIFRFSANLLILQRRFFFLCANFRDAFNDFVRRSDNKLFLLIGYFFMKTFLSSFLVRKLSKNNRKSKKNLFSIVFNRGAQKKKKKKSTEITISIEFFDVYSELCATLNNFPK